MGEKIPEGHYLKTTLKTVKRCESYNKPPASMVIDKEIKGL